MNQAISLPLSAFFNPQSNSEAARPFYPDDSSSDRARKFKKMLLDLAASESDQELKSVYRRTAEFFRESFFGLTEKQIKTRVRQCLEDYFDGETHTALEIDDVSEHTGIKAETLLPVLEKMVKDGSVVQGRRRRWNELGEHYNAIYCLPNKTSQ